MHSHNSMKVTTFTLAFSLALGSSVFAGWNKDLDAKKGYNELLQDCANGLIKATTPKPSANTIAEDKELEQAKTLSKIDLWKKRAANLKEAYKKGVLNEEDYKNLKDKVPSLQTVKKSPEQLWEEEITSLNRIKWFNTLMDAVEKEQPPAVSQQRIEKRKDSNKKAWRAFGSALLGAVSGSSEDEIAWPDAVKIVRTAFQNLAITEIPPATQWVKTYNLPTHSGFIHIKNYYPYVDQKIKENRERMKQEFIKNLT